MKYLTATAILSLLQSTPTMAQLQVSGPLTVGHSVKVVAPNVVSDAGPAAGGPAGTGLYELNVTKSPITGPNGPAPSCLYDAPITAAAGSHQLCFDPYNSTYNTAVLSYNALGAASPVGLTVLINGTAYPFVGGGGNVIGPTSPAPTGGFLTLWNGGTNIKTANNGNGSNVLGVDNSPGTLGNPLLIIGTQGSSAQMPLVAELNSGLPPNSNAFPAAINAISKLMAGSNGNQIFGYYGQTQIFATGGGTAYAAELDVGNFSGTPSDLSLPPITGPIGQSAITPIGVTINCLNGSTSDCNTGLTIANNGGNASQPRFNTGIYLWWFRQNGLWIEAQPTGTQQNIVSKSSGASYNIHMLMTGTYAANNAVLLSDNTTNSNVFAVRQSGAAEASGGLFSGGLSSVSPASFGGNLAASALNGVVAHQAFGNGTAIPLTTFAFARGTLASPTVILSGDRTMALTAYGYDGTGYQPTSQIASNSEGTISTNIVPGNLLLATANASGSLVTAETIDHFQNIMLSGASAIATNAVSPFAYLPTMAGLPTGVPNAAAAGRSAITIDSTDHKLCWYEQANAVWKCVVGS